MKKILISGQSYSGKTFWAKNLAQYLSDDSRVLLIDRDDGRRSLSQYLDIHIDSAFDRFDFYKGVCSLEKIILPVNNKLGLIQASLIYREEREEDEEDRIDMILNEAKSYDYLILDSGDFDEGGGSSFSKYFDYSIYVFRRAEDPEKFDFEGGKTGILLNMMDRDEAEFFKEEIYRFGRVDFFGDLPYDLSIEASSREFERGEIRGEIEENIEKILRRLKECKGLPLKKPSFLQRVFSFFKFGELFQKRKKYYGS